MKKYQFPLLTILLVATLFLQCSITKQEVIQIRSNNYHLHINPNNFAFHFTNKQGKVIVPPHSVTGLQFGGSKTIKVEKQADENTSTTSFLVTNENGEKATVNIYFEADIAKFSINPVTKDFTVISLQTGGMPIAHGLGDAGAFGESFNLVENKKTTYDINNNGGSKRWLSTFVIFPKNEMAGVYFTAGKKWVDTNADTYAMNIKTKSATSFYFVFGKPTEIYASYQELLENQGFERIKPKWRMFELGWESWDALGWNTNQKTVKNILAKFHQKDYPIKWAVTGSGFWETGGTTTSFGKWGEKFPNPKTFKNWMNANDINWMIGLRTNFIPDGGPYYPKTKKRDRNLKVKGFNGNALSNEALSKRYLLNKEDGHPLKITSTVFPIVPSYLLDGDATGAAEWFKNQFRKWGVDGIKEDTMMDTDSTIQIYNEPIAAIANDDKLVMARNGSFVAAGTLLRINDTGVRDIKRRLPINYFQYAASGFPNVYSDVAGVHNMHNVKDIARNIRHTWLLSLTAGMAVGAFPEKWSMEEQRIFKKAIDFHYRLVPYLYSAGVESHQTGFPYTLTPLTIALPNDNAVSKLTDFQWMIGESILAAPLLKNIEKGSREVYLPAGIWFDYESGKKYEGPQLLKDYAIPLEKVPVFIGGKGIIIERKNDILRAKIYPSTNKAKSTFYKENGLVNNTISIENPNWDAPKITNMTTGSEVRFSKVKNAFQFDLVEGQQYKIH
jgi:alpha-glucosidase (family GH31 glycosyl hydrolase)